MRLTNTIIIILLVVVAMGALALAYYREKRASFSLIPPQIQTPASLEAPSTPNLPWTPNLPVTPSSTPSTPPEIDTSDWKTYRNEEYGFEIKYPTDWFIEEMEYSVSFSPSKEEYETSHLLIGVGCPTFREAGFNNLKEYLQFNLNRDSGDKTLKVENVIINRLPGYKTTEYGLAQYDVIYLLKDNLCYKLGIDLFLPDSVVETSRKIRSTFRLNEIDETASWNIYRNEEYRYEVKYPKDFVTEESSYGIKFLSPEDVELGYLPHSPYSMFIHVEKISLEESLENWIKRKFWLKEFEEFKGVPSDETNYVDLIEKTFIGKDIQGYKLHRWIQASDQCLYYVRNKNKIIEISRLNKGQPTDLYRSCSDDPTLNKILSTFKFLPSISTIHINNHRI